MVTMSDTPVAMLWVLLFCEKIHFQPSSNYIFLLLFASFIFQNFLFVETVSSNKTSGH